MRTSRTRTEFAAKSFVPARSVRTIAELEHQGIAARIKQARKEKGLTQEQMAQLLDVRQRTYQNYESATTPRIPWDRMNDIERITKKKVEWLLHGDSPDLMGALNGNGVPPTMQEQLDRIEKTVEEILKRLGRPDEDEERGLPPAQPPPLPKGPPSPPGGGGPRRQQPRRKRAS